MALTAAGANTGDRGQSRYWGKYRGLVDSVEDDDNLARLIVRVPAVYGNDLSPPALPAVPFAGPGYGLLALPRAGDGIWVEFEAGDPSHPIWTGCWWALNELPDDAAAERRVFITRQGLKIILDDDSQTLQLLNGDDAEITMTTSDITIRLGQTKLVLDSTGVSINDGALQVRAV
jgi:hypothetical protein